jgi:hypothetical protein
MVVPLCIVSLFVDKIFFSCSLNVLKSPLGTIVCKIKQRYTNDVKSIFQLDGLVRYFLIKDEDDQWLF